MWNSKSKGNFYLRLITTQIISLKKTTIVDFFKFHFFIFIQAMLKRVRNTWRLKMAKGDVESMILEASLAISKDPKRSFFIIETRNWKMGVTLQCTGMWAILPKASLRGSKTIERKKHFHTWRKAADWNLKDEVVTLCEWYLNDFWCLINVL